MFHCGRESISFNDEKKKTTQENNGFLFCSSQGLNLPCNGKYIQ